MLRFGINANLTSGGQLAGLDLLAERAGGLAQRGFEQVAFANTSAGWDALTAIAVIGRTVPDVELATAVVPIQTRHPTAMAQQALTTQAATAGRLILGLGLSHRPVVENTWGLSFERPLEYMREYLAALLPLLRGEPVKFEGKRFKVQAQPLGASTSPPPVLLAALGERMLRLAGEQTEGTMTWMVGPKTLASHITPIITKAARDAGRPTPRIAVGLPICITSDADAARARAARGFERYGQLPSYRAMIDREGVAGPADIALIGSESDVERQLGEIESAGGTEITATVFGSSDDHRRTLEFLQNQAANARRTPV
jgi:F420-dependent oxidoreductase-like protein